MSVEQQNHAMAVFDEAELAEKAGDLEGARRFHLQAGQMYENVFDQLQPFGRPRTRAIVGTSAVSCYWSAEAWPEVLRFAPIVLAQLDPDDDYFRLRINTMLTDAQNASK